MVHACIVERCLSAHLNNALYCTYVGCSRPSSSQRMCTALASTTIVYILASTSLAIGRSLINPMSHIVDIHRGYPSMEPGPMAVRRFQIGSRPSKHPTPNFSSSALHRLPKGRWSMRRVSDGSEWMSGCAPFVVSVNDHRSVNSRVHSAYAARNATSEGDGSGPRYTSLPFPEKSMVGLAGPRW